MTGQYGVKRDVWRAANLIPCRLACRITLRRLLKLVGDDDPFRARDVDPHEIEMWCRGDEAAFVRRRKFLARATRSIQHALASGHVRARCFKGGEFVPVPGWAWIRDDRVQYVWSQNLLLFDALLPDTWALLSRSPAFVDRGTFATWLVRFLPMLSVESLDSISASEGPPQRIKSRLPADRPYIPLAEALSWLGYRVALRADDLYEFLQTGEIGDGVDWARARIAEAVERLADAALAGRVRCIGKHRTYSLGNKVPLTEEIPPIKFADYRRYDPVYDGLFFGKGLHDIGEGSAIERVLGDSRSDYFGSVQVHRGDLLTHFGGVARDATPRTRPSVNKPRVGVGTLRGWLERLGDNAQSSSQELLLQMARQHFRLNRVTRDQIRELTKGRKRGPKPITPESTAELSPK